MENNILYLSGFQITVKKNITKVIILTNRRKGKQFDEPIPRNSDVSRNARN